MSSEIKTRYADVVSEQQKVAVIDRLLGVNREYLRLTDARVQKGDAAPLEAGLLRVELYRDEAQRALTEGRVRSAVLGGVPIASSLSPELQSAMLPPAPYLADRRTIFISGLAIALGLLSTLIGLPHLLSFDEEHYHDGEDRASRYRRSRGVPTQSRLTALFKKPDVAPQRPRTLFLKLTPRVLHSPTKKGKCIGSGPRLWRFAAHELEGKLCSLLPVSVLYLAPDLTTTLLARAR